MAWGYRIEVLNAREAGRCRDAGRGCSAGKCGDSPQFLSVYRYARVGGRAITASRPLCVKHARLFSMKFSLAWPDRLKRVRRPLAGVWGQLAA
jgi:hypothetical protein